MWGCSYLRSDATQRTWIQLGLLLLGRDQTSCTISHAEWRQPPLCYYSLTCSYCFLIFGLAQAESGFVLSQNNKGMCFSDEMQCLLPHFCVGLWWRLIGMHGYLCSGLCFNASLAAKLTVWTGKMWGKKTCWFYFCPFLKHYYVAIASGKDQHRAMCLYNCYLWLLPSVNPPIAWGRTQIQIYMPLYLC